MHHFYFYRSFVWGIAIFLSYIRCWVDFWCLHNLCILWKNHCIRYFSLYLLLRPYRLLEALGERYPPQKKVMNSTKTNEKHHCEGKPYQLVVSEMLRYRQTDRKTHTLHTHRLTDISLLLYKVDRISYYIRLETIKIS